jgi:xanthine dehydrogenase FAD-binding subunit
MEVLFPRSLAALQEMFAAYPGAVVMAGGTDVLVRLRGADSRPPALICLERLDGIKCLERRGDQLFIGAGVTIGQLAADDAVGQAVPALRQAASLLGSPPVRHAATLGGNICTASPAGDTLPPLYAADATVETAGPEGCRRLAVADFVAGPGRTVLRPGELVTGVSVPACGRDTLSAYYKVGRRRATAIAVVSLAVRLRLGGDGSVEMIRLAWGSVGPTVIRLPAVEDHLRGRRLSAALLREAGAMVAAAVKPIDDVRARAAYRRRVAGNLLLRLAGQEE